MRKLIIACLWISSTAVLAEEQITLSTAQINNLGVKIGSLTAVKSVPLMDAPAKVSIPPANEYLVSTSHAGLVNQIYVSIGDEVVKGQVLAMVRSPELLALQQRHLKSVNDLRVAKTKFTRDGKLYKEGVIADRRWLETKANYQVFKSHFNETRQLLEITGISQSDIKALEKTHKMSSQLKIAAPISGVVLNRMVTAGERVDALVPLFRVANLEKLWLDISIPQQRIGQVHEGDTVLLDGTEIVAKIFLLSKSVNEENQTVLVRADVETGKDSLRLGQTFSVKIRQTSEHPMFKVPNAALAQFKGKSYLFVRNNKGFAVKPVQVLGREEQKSIIAGDINANNKIAIRGAVALKANFLRLGSDE
jgi:cobalt-zinc-cadmium efflux system membrane fusion protein